MKLDKGKLAFLDSLDGHQRKLALAVIRQFNAPTEEVEYHLRDVAKHGDLEGWPGWTYYWETADWLAKHKKLVQVELEREEIAIGDVLEWRSFKGAGVTCWDVCRALFSSHRNEDVPFIENTLALFALEQVANWYADWLENQGEGK